MAYSDTYWLNCVDDLHYNSACVEAEFGKVRSAGFIRKRYLQTLLASPLSNAVWQTGISNGGIYLLPKVSGSFDPGEPVALKGYGKRLYTRGPREMVLQFSDPSFSENYLFYNRIQTHTDLVPFFRTSTHVQIADRPADVFSRDVIDEDIESIVAWETKATWRGVDLPIMIDASSLAVFVGAPFVPPIRHHIFSKEFAIQFE